MADEYRTFWFEVFECLRKAFLVCLPVFIDPGSIAQLIFGLMVCFLSAMLIFAPYEQDSDDSLARMCQLQLFFSLLSSLVLKAPGWTRSSGITMDLLLMFLLFLPIFTALLSLLADSKELVEEISEMWLSLFPSKKDTNGLVVATNVLRATSRMRLLAAK